MPFIIVIAPLYTVGRSGIITSFLLVLPRYPPVRNGQKNYSVSDPDPGFFGEFVPRILIQVIGDQECEKCTVGKKMFDIKMHNFHSSTSSPPIFSSSHLDPDTDSQLCFADPNESGYKTLGNVYF